MQLLQRYRPDSRSHRWHSKRRQRLCRMTEWTRQSCALILHGQIPFLVLYTG